MSKNLKTFKLFAIVLLAVSALSLESCKVEGCTDADSVNYDASADEDDGTCEYEGNFVFWYNQTTAGNLIENDAQSLTIYVDGKVIGSYATNVYFASAPSCSESSVVTDKKDLGSDKKKSFSYKVIDDDNYTWWDGTIQYEANSCITLELDLSKSLSHKKK